MSTSSIFPSPITLVQQPASHYWKQLYNDHFTSFCCPVCKIQEECRAAVCGKCRECNVQTCYELLCRPCASKKQSCALCGDCFKQPLEYLKMVTDYINEKKKDLEFMKTSDHHKKILPDYDWNDYAVQEIEHWNKILQDYKDMITSVMLTSMQD